jgi:hypothetical protein
MPAARVVHVLRHNRPTLPEVRHERRLRRVRQMLHRSKPSLPNAMPCPVSVRGPSGSTSTAA